MALRDDLISVVDKVLSVRLFDAEAFYWNLKKMVDRIFFFHNVIGAHASTPKQLSQIKFDVPKDKMPRDGQVAYFNIEHSYPKEIFNGHWCYVFRNLGNTVLIIPLTSFKEDSAPVKDDVEMEIQVSNFCEDGASKLKIHQMFCADWLRLDQRKDPYEVTTDKAIIQEKIKNVLFGA